MFQFIYKTYARLLQSSARGGLLRNDVLAIAVVIQIAIPHTTSAAPLTPTGVEEERFMTEILWESVRRLPVGERPRIVLVLGGGGARGLSHIGVLRVLEQERIPVDGIVGISVGALLGSLYAGGVTTEKLERMAGDIGWNKLTDYSKASMFRLVTREELLSTEKMESYLETHLGKKNFENLNIPFLCIATDIQTGERIVFDEGPVAIAARASATIPGFFEPVQINGRSLVDGGLSDVLPTDIAVNGSDWGIVVAVLPSSTEEKIPADSVLKTLVRSLEIQTSARIEEKKKRADFVIEPNVGEMSFYDVNKGEDAIQAGIQATRARSLDLKRMIIRRVLEKNTEAVGER